MGGIMGALGMVGRNLGKGVRYAANVPKGEKFFNGVMPTAKRLMTLGFNPNVGKFNKVKHVINGITAYGLGKELVQGPLANVLNNPAWRQAEQLPGALPDVPFASPQTRFGIGALGELAGVNAFKPLDYLPNYMRDAARESGRRSLASGLKDQVTDFSKMHTDKWLTTKKFEPFKMVASPLAKPTAAFVSKLWQ